MAQHLGVGITTVLRMCQRGELHPTRGADGVWRYDPAEVVRRCAERIPAARRSAGQTAAAVYQMFDSGAELREIVLALQIPAEEVRRHYRDWQSSLDDPPPATEEPSAALLDQEPGADEAFARAMAQAGGLVAPAPQPQRKRGSP